MARHVDSPPAPRGFSYPVVQFQLKMSPERCFRHTKSVEPVSQSSHSKSAAMVQFVVLLSLLVMVKRSGEVYQKRTLLVQAARRDFCAVRDMNVVGIAFQLFRHVWKVAECVLTIR